MISGGQQAPRTFPVAELKTIYCGTDTSCAQAIDQTKTKYNMPDPMPEEVYAGFVSVRGFCGGDKKSKFNRDSRFATSAACVAGVLGNLSNYPQGTANKFFLKSGGQAIPDRTMGSAPLGIFERWLAAHPIQNPSNDEPVELTDVATDPEGNSVIPSFVAQAKPKKPFPLEEVGAKVELILDPDELMGSVSISGKKVFHRTPGAQASVSASVAVEKSPAVPSHPHFVHDPYASASEGHGHLGLSLSLLKPLDGSLDVSFPTVDLLAKNGEAQDLEEKYAKRWIKDDDDAAGKRAVEIYLARVLRPWMINATKQNLEEAWKTAVTTGTQDFEATLTSATMIDPAGANGPGWVTAYAKMFKYDPLGFVETVALWAGKTYEEVQGVLGAEIDLLRASTDANREVNFKAFIEAVRRQNWTKSSAMPANFEGRPESPARETFSARNLGKRYFKELEAKEGDIMLAMGITSQDDLKRMASAPEKYPFEKANDPGNAWAAQKMYDDFLAGLKERYAKRADLYLTLDAGLVEYAMAYSGLGVSTGLKWVVQRDADGEDKLVVSPKFYLGYPQSQISNDGIELKGGDFGAAAIGADVGWNPWKLQLSSALHYAFGNAPDKLISWNVGAALPLPFAGTYKFIPSLSAGGGMSTTSSSSSYQIAPGLKLSKTYDRDRGIAAFLSGKLVFANGNSSVSSGPVDASDGGLRDLDGTARGDSDFDGINERRGPRNRVLRGGLGMNYGRVTVEAFIQYLLNQSHVDTGEDSGTRETGSRTFIGLGGSVVTNE